MQTAAVGHICWCNKRHSAIQGLECYHVTRRKSSNALVGESLTLNTYWQGLKHGDPGFLVVDFHTSAILGHVVAVNPLEYVYVSSLTATISQVKSLFPGKQVSLPDALLLSIQLATRCVKLGLPTAALGSLDFLEQAMKTGAARQFQGSSKTPEELPALLITLETTIGSNAHMGMMSTRVRKVFPISLAH
jgi:hypothetical protein